MFNAQTPSTTHGTDQNSVTAENNNEEIREIHALTPPPRPNFEPHTHHTPPSFSTDNFSSMSREFSALVLAGSTIDHTSPISMNMSSVSSNIRNNNNSNNNSNSNDNNLGRNRIEEGELLMMEETNPLAIVADTNPLEAVSNSPPRRGGNSSAVSEVTVQRVRKEEVEAKIAAWQNAKVAKINNRFKREDAVINGWQNEQVQKASSWMKKVERKLEEKRAKAQEKMQNEVAKAQRKAEERRASAEAKRGTKVARVMEIANLMRAVGRAPTKRSFF